jgi:hypothetical protein
MYEFSHGLGPERRFAAMQWHSRYRRKTGLDTDGLNPALLTPITGRRRSKLFALRDCLFYYLVGHQQEGLGDR